MYVNSNDQVHRFIINTNGQCPVQESLSEQVYWDAIHRPPRVSSLMNDTDHRTEDVQNIHYL